MQFFELTNIYKSTFTSTEKGRGQYACACFSPFAHFCNGKTEVRGLVCVCVLKSVACACVCGQLTLDLRVQVVDYNLELPQRHVSQVGGLEASFH